VSCLIHCMTYILMD